MCSERPINKCPAGSYCPLGTALAKGTPCPAGTWSDAEGLVSASQCKPVKAGRFSYEGETRENGSGPCAKVRPMPLPHVANHCKNSPYAISNNLQILGTDKQRYRTALYCLCRGSTVQNDQRHQWLWHALQGECNFSLCANKTCT